LESDAAVCTDDYPGVQQIGFKTCDHSGQRRDECGGQTENGKAEIYEKPKHAGGKLEC